MPGRRTSPFSTASSTSTIRSPPLASTNPPSASPPTSRSIPRARNISGWTNHSRTGEDDFNTIDPNLVMENKNTAWLNWGSFLGRHQDEAHRPQDRQALAQGHEALFTWPPPS